MLSVPTRWVWINLWKLWIVFDGPVGCRAARARPPPGPRPVFLSRRRDGVSLVR